MEHHKKRPNLVLLTTKWDHFYLGYCDGRLMTVFQITLIKNIAKESVPAGLRKKFKEIADHPNKIPEPGVYTFFDASQLSVAHICTDCHRRELIITNLEQPENLCDECKNKQPPVD